MRKYIKVIIFIIVLISFIIISGVISCLKQFPNNDTYIPQHDETPLSQPIRPGIGDIIITGPERKPLLFTIDLASNSIEIDWQQLMGTDPTATITVDGYIDDNGIFYIQKLDDAGHTNVGRIISKKMTTWRYTFYKNGNIQFYFNLPSEEEKLIIDSYDLKRNPDIADFVPIQDGMLYYIPGLSSELVKYGSIN
ncbi:MAG: hypothetical protein R6V04_07945 [bacterium]